MVTVRSGVMCMATCANWTKICGRTPATSGRGKSAATISGCVV
jgi:hypothetical protein